MITPKSYPSLSESLSDPVEMIEALAFLQPHIYLFKPDSDLLSFRLEIKLKDPDFWSMLNQFQSGAKIERVLKTLEQSQMEEAKEKLQSWIQKWISNKWLHAK